MAPAGPLAGQLYRKVFGELGAAEVTPIHTTNRAQCSSETSVRAVEGATGIFLTGGNQLRLSSTIGGTPLAQAVVRRHREGAVAVGARVRGLLHRGARGEAVHRVGLSVGHRLVQGDDGAVDGSAADGAASRRFGRAGASSRAAMGSSHERGGVCVDACATSLARG